MVAAVALKPATIGRPLFINPAKIIIAQKWTAPVDIRQYLLHHPMFAAADLYAPGKGRKRRPLLGFKKNRKFMSVLLATVGMTKPAGRISQDRQTQTRVGLLRPHCHGL